MIYTKALREKVLDLAIRGKLVPQDPNDEPASVLLERIRAEKEQMVKDGKLKAKDIKNDTFIFKGDDNLHYEQFPDRTVKCIEDEIPFDIPEGWSWCRLSMVGTTNIGLTYKPTEVKETGTIVLRSCNIKNGKMDFADLVRVQADIRENQYIYEKDILICARNGSRSLVGKCAIMQGLTEVASFGAFMAVFRSICNQYVYYYFNTSLFRRSFDNDDSKQINQVTQAILRDTLIPLPPFAEQNRIVTKLHETLSLVDFINGGTEQIATIITNTKTKILDLAIRGKLVPQNPDDEPAAVLLERIRAEKEELIKQGKIKRNKKESVIFRGEDNSYYRDLPINWAVSSLSEITTSLLLNDGDWILSDNMVPFGDIKLIQLGSVGFLKYADKGFKYLTPEMFTKLNCTEIHSGYMLINRIVSDKMCACVLPEIEGKKITTVDTCWIAPKDEWYNLKYILFAISSPIYQSLVMLNSSGTTRKRISKSNLISLPLALPPLAEQKQIVEAIEIAFTQLDEILNSIS